MDYSLLIAYLRQKQYITDLEKDILDTWNELQKSPFDRSSAQLQTSLDKGTQRKTTENELPSLTQCTA